MSRIGIKKLRPGSRIVLNFPILSTSQASCCGTNITPTFTGVPVDFSLVPEGMKEVERRGAEPQSTERIGASEEEFSRETTPDFWPISTLSR